MQSCFNQYTDKLDPHTYSETYDFLFRKIRTNYIDLLEIGIDKGGSMKLWHDYFPFANIYGLDAKDLKDNPKYDQKIRLPEIYFSKRIHMTMEVNAYDEKFIEEKFKKNNMNFDIIIDDGPHNIESMCFFVKNYSKLLKENGILIIEDIQSPDWIPQIMLHVPFELRKYSKVIDLRHNGKRYDDILLVIDKLNC